MADGMADGMAVCGRTDGYIGAYIYIHIHLYPFIYIYIDINVGGRGGGGWGVFTCFLL